jgi:hypothetical protein
MKGPDLAKFAGKFTTPIAEATVTVSGDELQVEQLQEGPGGKWVPAPVAHAVPVGPAEFLIVDGPLEGATFDYILDAGGQIRFRRAGGRLQEPVET